MMQAFSLPTHYHNQPRAMPWASMNQPVRLQNEPINQELPCIPCPSVVQKLMSNLSEIRIIRKIRGQKNEVAPHLSRRSLWRRRKQDS
jgi:hypothetical protein